jgi:hypothetical protein
MTACLGVALFALLAGHTVPDGFFNAQTVMVLAFCGGNAAATFAYAKTSSQTDTTNRAITEKRNGDTEHTP